MRILIPVDLDEERARALGETMISMSEDTQLEQVTILNVTPKVEDFDGFGGQASSDEWFESKEYPPSVNTIHDMLAQSDIPVERIRKHGEPAKTIIETAEEIDADRIMMYGRKKSPIGKVLFGSVTQAVLIDSDIPVTII